MITNINKFKQYLNESISNNKMKKFREYLQFSNTFHFKNMSGITHKFDNNNLIDVFMNNSKRLSCTFYTLNDDFKATIYEYNNEIYTYEFKLMNAEMIDEKQMMLCVKNAIEISLRIAQPMRSKKIKTDTYDFRNDFIVSDDININDIVYKTIFNKFKLNEPCKHENLKAEFMGGGFIHTCVDCGADVYVPRKQKEEKPKYTGNEYWRSGWNKGYGPQSEEEYRTGKWKK